ncbi:MAG: hypothetical protein HY819_10940 [Acidobacteria bacterium]|nr:hypothetical protein [Acidobacteriota bacterium]
MLKLSFPIDAQVDSSYLEEKNAQAQNHQELIYSPINSLTELDYWSAAKTFTQAKYLALSMLPIQEIAIQVAYDAMLAAQVCRNKQYTYRKSWLKNNRYKKYGPTKALLHKNQLVQNFVYREIEKYEKYTEGDFNQPINSQLLEDLLKNFILSEENLIIRYIKFLIQMAEDNSANAVLATTKLIYKYRTIDVAEIYTRLHGDGPVDNYFSKRKGEFIRRLEERFQSLINQDILKVVVGNKREKYFQGQEIFDDKWSNLVKQTFNSFIPWGTNCLPKHSKGSFIDSLFSWFKDIFSEDQKKILSIHTLFCPNCFNSLVKELNLASPEKQLALPTFNLSKISKEKSLPMSSFNYQDPITEKTEIRNILNRLHSENLRREQLINSGIKNIFITNNDLKILDLDLSKDRNASISIKDDFLTSKNILKIYSIDRQGDLLFATVVLNKHDRSSINIFNEQKFSLLEGKQNIFLLAKYIEDNENSHYLLKIKYRENLLEETALFWHEYSSIMQSVWLK